LRELQKEIQGEKKESGKERFGRDEGQTKREPGKNRVHKQEWTLFFLSFYINKKCLQKKESKKRESRKKESNERECQK